MLITETNITFTTVLTFLSYAKCGLNYFEKLKQKTLNKKDENGYQGNMSDLLF